MFQGVRMCLNQTPKSVQSYEKSYNRKLNMTFSAQSISTYISNLEKDNAALRKRLQQCEEEKALLEYDNMLKYAVVSDEESVASYDESDNESINDDSAYGSETESESESEFETESESETETEHESELEPIEYNPDSESNDDYFVCHNLSLTKAFDDIAQNEENEFKRDVYERAADIIHNLDFKLTHGEQISHLHGIGPSIIRKINEFIETGQINTTKTFVTNENISEELENIAQKQDCVHKTKAYEKAADSIRKAKFEVTNGTEISQGPRKLPGIGCGIARKIDEYIVNGRTQYDETLGRLNIGPRPVVC
tara:strand:+ start:162 stop:1091 length:930 start_codon:yes stop_codon:yes gene_type:complete